MGESPNYSIIIPHKNIPMLLRRCLASISQRDDLEVIVVDDNSDPNIVDFNSFSGKNRLDVTLIFDKKGGGAGRARNLGLDAARGKFVLFADADDWFTPCFDQMLDKYANTTADIVFFNAVSMDSETYAAARRVEHIKRVEHLNRYIALYKRNRQKGEAQLRYMFGEPWCKIVRKTVIDEHAIRFDEVPLHNDATFSYMVGFYARTALADEHAIYVVTYRKNSLRYLNDDKRRLARIDVFAKDERFRKDNCIKVKGGILNCHYREAGVILLERKFSLFKRGIAIIRQYNPSLLSICVNIFTSMFCAAITLLSRVTREFGRIVFRL